MILIQYSLQDKEVVHSLLANIFELIGHAIHVILGNSHEIRLGLDGVCSWLSNSSISMHFVNMSSERGGLVFMVCRSRDAMNYVPSILLNLVVTKSNEFLSLLR